MRFLKPASTEGVSKLSAGLWSSTGEEGAFVFDLPSEPAPFVGIFLQVKQGSAAPKIAFDQGDGFNEVSSIVFRPLSFGFYHLSLRTVGAVRRLRFRACEAPATFRCLVFQTAQPILVAVLHYLFYLRFLDVPLVAPTPGGRRGWWPLLRSNVTRIRKFMGDVSAGDGVRVQQAEDDVLARVRLAQTLQVKPVQDAMREQLGQRSVPLISFISPVYNTDPAYLRDLLDTFAAEDAPYAELILANDGSSNAATKTALSRAAKMPGVRVVHLPRNSGIAAATNAGLQAARGEWVSFIDHDDAFCTGAIGVIAKAITGFPDADFFYTDEVVTDQTLHNVGAFCKPAFDPVLLTGINYINHFSVFRRPRVLELGGLRADCEGSQDYDLLLRYLVGARPGSVVHIPFLAYVWRRGEGSYSTVFRERSVNNAREALKRAYDAPGAPVAVEAAQRSDLHRIRFVGAARPLVSVIIPNRDSYALITRVVADLKERTNYPDLEIVVPDNGTADPDVLRFYEAHRGERFKADVMAEPFNFSRMCNRGARLARGDAILFLNNDIEVIDRDWLSEMVECLSFPATGIVGARLLYPNGTLQHAGVMVGLGEAAGHWYVNDPLDEPGPMGRLAVRQSYGAVTGACMLVTRTCFDALRGFDETAFPISYNDVDLCIRARHAGYRTVWTPFATLYHHESASRGSDEEGENNIRFRVEFARLQERHGTKTLIDDAYSPFYDRRYSQPHLISPPELPEPRVNVIA